MVVIYKTYNKKRGSVVADPCLTQFTARRAATNLRSKKNNSLC